MQESALLGRARAMIHAVSDRKRVESPLETSVELASLLLQEAQQRQAASEKALQGELAGMMNDPIGKVFVTSVTDQCFRSQNPSRIANQLIYLMDTLGIPSFLSAFKKAGLLTFRVFGAVFPGLFVPIVKYMLRKQTSTVILPGEAASLDKHLKRRADQGIRVNLNHLGEAVLGEEEAGRRLKTYLEDLDKPEIEYISVKISTISSQLNLIAWDQTINRLAEGLRQLYREANRNRFTRPDGSMVPKFVNLDMEEYRDLHLTVELFRKVLDEPEFLHHSAGIVLQAYLPDSFLLQQQLTTWALERVRKGGAPIKIRIVKGANLAMEQVEASLKGWHQAPYNNKKDVDANFKRMVDYGCQASHARACYIGIGSHNLFDIAYALLKRAEQGVEKEVCFEMLEGMADHMRRVIQDVSGDMLLYCPAATKDEFQNAVAYLVRRLDENTAPENFLRHSFDLKVGSKEWLQQVNLFAEAYAAKEIVRVGPRRLQDRSKVFDNVESCCQFENESDTDWSLEQNRRWGESILKEWRGKQEIAIPLVIGGEELWPAEHCGTVGIDPSIPGRVVHRHRLASASEIERTLQVAKEAQKSWSRTSIQERSERFAAVAQGLRMHRKALIGAMVADTGKTVAEADAEVSEAIDFAEYYRRTAEEWFSLQDVQLAPKGTALVAPPWNFPCSIPFGGIAAALLCGNCVIFKPAMEAILVGWQLAQILWEAGIPKEVFQFVPCADDPTGSQLVGDGRIDCVILTGATATAKHLLQLRPNLDLIAETGGKNSIIVSALSDRDLAIKHLIHSAFGHAGQKCSACSLGIVEAEVYDDPHFLRQLRDAAASLPVGSAWDPFTSVNPLIRPPGETLKRGLTMLEPGETWLLEPKPDLHNDRLWSPGIKLGVKEGSFTHKHELFGPVLSLMRADNMDHAYQLANATQYGLTAGLHSLDEREHLRWMDVVEAGNCYINRTITGAIVRRQPFGGCKDSSFGRGFKAGGPNYLTQMVAAKQIHLPQERDVCNPDVMVLDKYVRTIPFSTEERDIWNASIESYAFYWNHYFSQDHDPSLLVGQDNLLRYVPHKATIIRMQPEDSPLDILRECASALTCAAPVELSGERGVLEKIGFNEWSKNLPQLTVVVESESEFIVRVCERPFVRIRLLTSPTALVLTAVQKHAFRLILGPTLVNGRLQLLNYLREISFSIDYHRYGNLGSRENEPRSTIKGNTPKAIVGCGTSCCCC